MIPPTNPQEASKDVILVTSRRNKTLGLCFLLVPVCFLFFILTAYAISNFVIQSLTATAPSSATILTTTSTLVQDTYAAQTDIHQTVGRIINAALGLLGILCVLGIIIGIPIGILFLVKKEPVNNNNFDTRSGNGDASVIPPEIQRWSWGGFGLTWIWGVTHGVWFSLLVFLPLIGIIVRFYLGFKGNELAWKRNKWTSVEAFHQSQKTWGIIGGILFFLTLAPLLLLVLLP